MLCLIYFDQELHSYGDNDVRKVVSLWFYILYMFNMMHY